MHIECSVMELQGCCKVGESVVGRGSGPDLPAPAAHLPASQQVVQVQSRPCWQALAFACTQHVSHLPSPIVSPGMCMGFMGRLVCMHEDKYEAISHTSKQRNLGAGTPQRCNGPQLVPLTYLLLCGEAQHGHPPPRTSQLLAAVIL
jgi:hypothetical protein